MTSPSPSYREIPLTRGQVALVDPEDYERIARHTWGAHWSQNNRSFYAVRRARVNGNRIWVPMASAVLDVSPPSIADHITHATLDNRKYNLREATDEQNRRNKRRYSNNTSGYKGVSFSKKEGKWVANIMIDGKYKHLGYSDDRQIAARLYDDKAYEVYGEFAFLNFPHHKPMFALPASEL